MCGVGLRTVLALAATAFLSTYSSSLVGTAMPEYRTLRDIRDMTGPREEEHMKKV
jgi:hypothetical protein